MIPTVQSCRNSAEVAVHIRATERLDRAVCRNALDKQIATNCSSGPNGSIFEGRVPRTQKSSVADTRTDSAVDRSCSGYQRFNGYHSWSR